ncbi:MAG: PhnD/SsuA/transferrin family substrate-binding protein [Gammaproteobacteria bacterium]|nr:PhnD/SsuA/transferrin family substrate-binding protein [Gammaproteobacteria bacterium]
MTLTRCLPLLLACLGGSLAAAEPLPITIGVLSHRGDEATVRNWGPTADYLSSQLRGIRFEVLPLEFQAVEPAVAEGRIDFVLVNSGMYVDLEVGHGVTRIATLNNRHAGRSYNTFGGVLFTRADRGDLTALASLRGQRLAAVNRVSLGGFQMQWREMHAHGIDPWRDLAGIDFANTHDAVVRRVLDGRADVGAVRTNILERMVEDGTIDADDVRIIAPRPAGDFPLRISTRLYPEWPFAKTRGTPNELAQRVAVALLQMPPDHPAALSGHHAGWTVPLDYQPVHELFQDLGIGPYSQPGPFTFGDVLDKYRGIFIAGGLMLLVVLGMSARIIHLNTQLERAKSGIERRFELILDAVGDGVSGVDTDGMITFVNPEMERLTGWSADELIGRPQHDLLHHSRADGTPYPRSECPVGATFRENRAHHVDDEVFWRKDGTSFPVEYASSPIRDREGAVLGAVVVCRDVTARKAAEEAQRRHVTEMAHVARLSTMGEMASQIAHELNQPLAAITNYTGACVRRLQVGRDDPGPILEALQLVSAQAHRAAQIVRRIRDFIRKQEPGRGPIDLNDLVRQTSLLVAPEARANRVGIVLDLADGLPAVVGDGVELEQVIMNLVRNAIDAVSHNPRNARRVTVRTANEGGNVHLSVVDNGPGMDESTLREAFTPFYTTKVSGMGLGLALSRRIVEAHGGRLWAETNPDEGATLSVRLPADQEKRDVA